ncbi:hypothetical protein GM1_037_00120 [Gordonia malaquae NBRC 108250]|uniref:DUF7224 domain-containing protein n=3 Tax=Gordonia TaxID=2053 RepID=M3TJ50_GORML|nr:hypothetical protein [Gordonia spumicola]GAC81541.1 hypothetical protein GM1_037_00120 [Gordonia malaquae NBRC 108250]GEE00621.1 hypothetical protein nbrc107696_10670 [Gordonia spumicola]
MIGNVIGPATILVSIIAYGAGAFHSGSLLPPWEVAVGVISTVGCFALIGGAFGCLARRAISVPLMLVVGYLWMVMPGAVQPYWIRNLNGSWIGCCGIESELSATVFWAGTIQNLAIALAALVLITTVGNQRRAIWISIAIIIPLAAAFIGAASTSDVGPTADVERSTPLVCSSSDEVTYCTWPEISDDDGNVAAIIASVRTDWKRAGFDSPGTYRAITTSPSEVVFMIIPDAPDIDIRQSLTNAVVNHLPVCAENPSGYAPALDPIELWLLRRSGVNANTDVPGVTELVQRIEQKSPAKQAAWLDRTLNAIANCGDVSPEAMEP